MTGEGCSPGGGAHLLGTAIGVASPERVPSRISVRVLMLTSAVVSGGDRDFTQRTAVKSVGVLEVERDSGGRAGRHDVGIERYRLGWIHVDDVDGSKAGAVSVVQICNHAAGEEGAEGTGEVNLPVL